MLVVATKSFDKQISKLKDGTIARKIEHVMGNMEKVKSLSEIPNIKKMAGAPNAFVSE